MEIELLDHQTQLSNAPWELPGIDHIFEVAGFGSGKSFGVVASLLKIVKRYWRNPVAIGIGSTTLALLDKTVIRDLEKVLIETGARYEYNRSKNIIKIGNLRFVMVATGQPALIYGYNFSAFFADELDELEQTKAIEAYGAIQERVRVPFPDGRNPYTVITTTAQGYRGVYRIVEDLKIEKERYCLIRASTKSNTHNSPRFYQKLYALYNKNERRAYLEGEFVNLTAGRVYPEYEESRHMVADIQLQPFEVVHIGQDLNRGFSKAVAWVIRDKKIYAVKEFSFVAIGQAPQILRSTFPNNEILWYPDASGKEIMSGYLSEISAQDIQIRFANQNPGIIDRVMVINKLFMNDRAFVCRSCQQLSMALKTRQYDDKGNPEKGSGEKAPDHICDAAEYSSWRIVSSNFDFIDLYELTREYNKSRGD